MLKTKNVIFGLFDSVNEAAIVSFYNKKAFQLKQLYSELSIPIIVSSAFMTVYANSAAIELLGISRDSLKETGILSLLPPEHLSSVVTLWCAAVMEYKHIDKLKIQVLKPAGGTLECMLNATIHREPFTGTPVLETFFFLPLS